MDPHALKPIDALRAAMAYKDAAVKEHGLSAHSDVPFSLHLYRHGVGFGFVYTDTTNRTAAHLALTFVLGSTDCDQALVVADSYMYSPPTPDAAFDADLDDLALAFAQGRPGVTEALMVATWTRDDEAHTQSLVPYRVAPGRHVEYGKVAEYRQEDWLSPGGALHEAIVRGFALQGERPFPPLASWRELKAELDLGRIATVMPPITAPTPDRNSACPCGSGHKAKRCCYR